MALFLFFVSAEYFYVIMNPIHNPFPRKGHFSGGITQTEFALFPSMCAQHGRNLTGESPECGLIVPSTQLKARVSTARWNLKEAGGKLLV